MNILIDMGNTRLKWAIHNNGQLTAGQPLANQQLDRQNLIRFWGGAAPAAGDWHRLCQCRALIGLVQAVALELWPDSKILAVKSRAHAFGVIDAYQHPEQLGVDRWLALIAARRHYGAPVCIADCGTAQTVDLLAADGHHLGGFISPGLTLMKQALAKGTAALPFDESHYAAAPANVTEAAIYAGSLFSAVGLIEHVLDTQTPAMPLILTGGDAALIARQLTVAAVIDADLVLKGLAIVIGET